MRFVRAGERTRAPQEPSDTCPMELPSVYWRAVIIRGLIGAIDRGVTLPVDKLREHIETGDIVEWLSVAFGEPIISLDFLTAKERRSFESTLSEHRRQDKG